MQVPHTETFAQFQERLRYMSSSVAGDFIAGRTTGFTAEDGKWKYVLIDRQGGKGREGELGSTLLYLAMVSEMVKAWSEWNHVEVWNVSFLVA